MTLKTLNYIQNLLDEDYQKKGLKAKWAKDFWLDEEEKNPDSDKSMELHDDYDKLRAERDEAYEALQDFMNHDWH